MLEEIRQKIADGRFELSKHAVDQMFLRRITVPEIREAFSTSELVEDYPDDKYGPSCLLFGRTLLNRALHIQCSHPSRPMIKIVTVYEPVPELWVDFKTRKS